MKYYPETKQLKFSVESEILWIDTERKMLPFKMAAKAKVKTAHTWEEYIALMEAGCGQMDLSGNPEKAAYYDLIKVVIVDSFTRITFLLSEYLKRKRLTGFDFWRDFGDMLEKLLMTWQSKGRWIVFTAIDDVVQDSDRIDRKVVKVAGRMSGTIESFFSVVLFTNYNNMKKPEEAYQFCTNTDGKNSAKSPIGMFDKQYIPNDLSFVLGSIYDYYDMKNNPEFIPSPILIAGKSSTGKSTSSSFLIDEKAL